MIVRRTTGGHTSVAPTFVNYEAPFYYIFTSHRQPSPVHSPVSSLVRLSVLNPRRDIADACLRSPSYGHSKQHQWRQSSPRRRWLIRGCVGSCVRSCVAPPSWLSCRLRKRFSFMRPRRLRMIAGICCKSCFFPPTGHYVGGVCEIAEQEGLEPPNRASQV